MIDIALVRNQIDVVIAQLTRRGVPRQQVEKLAKLDEQWRQLTTEVDTLRSHQNEASAHIATAGAQERKELIADAKKIDTSLEKKDAVLTEVSKEREEAWRVLPNLPLMGVPDGGTEDFEIVRTVPEQIPAKNFQLKSYFELAEPRLVDFARAAKVSGSRFVYIKGELARLQIALTTYVFDQLSSAGFTPIIPPVLISEKAMAGMGYLDHTGDEVYRTQDNLYLVGTSEQSIGAMHMNETLSSEELPLRYVGYSTCFRREAGSHGKDTKGMLRLHQFDKIEMFSFTSPESQVSETEHQFLLRQQEKIVQALELPYRVITLAAKDLGAPAGKTYDIETWIPSEGRYRETHSTSNTTDYQSRRLNIGVKEGGGIRGKAHMLNGTALAMSRILIALLENHQQADGSIVIPKVLHPYLPFTHIPATA